MHPAPAFRAPDDAAAALVRAVGFATIVAVTPDGLLAAHSPLLLSDDARTVRFHLSRANAMTPHLDGAAMLDYEGALALEARMQRELGRAHDYAEGVAAFLEKRAPVFTDR